MKTVIVGAGAVGFQIAMKLVDNGKDIVLIEKEQERYQYVNNQLDCIVINDDAIKIDVLKQAGIDDCDFFISVTDSDEINMILCSMVNFEFKVACKIARVRNINYSTEQILQNKNFGIDYILNPEVEAAKVIVNAVEYGALSNIKKFEQTDLQIRNFLIQENSHFKDKTAKEIRDAITEPFLIVGINREEEFIIPGGNTHIKANDILYIIARDSVLSSIFKQLGKAEQKLTSVIIIGGGGIGRQISRDLIAKGKAVTIVEKNRQICKEIAEELPSALIIQGDITEEGLFQEENLCNHDLIITATGNQDLNILTAVYAKAIGITRSIALVMNRTYLIMANRLGIDATANPKMSIADSIIRIIRSGNTKTIHSMLDGNTEIIEFWISKDSPIIDIAVKNIKLPKKSLLVSVTRDNISYIPDGDFVINPADDVIVISAKEAVPTIEKIFNG